MAASAQTDLTGQRGGDVLTVFTALWAAATLFHLWGNPWALDVFGDPTALGVSHVLTGVAALTALAWPQRLIPLGALAAGSLVTAWLEAPVIGNHWVVGALVGMAILGALLWGRGDRARVAAALVPAAGATLVVFYGFAAFAKINSAFFDPVFSCGTFYLDETLGSLGWSTPWSATDAGWARAVPIAIVATELSIPVLLAVRRTRLLGVVLGLVFHSLIGLDQDHQFYDFSSLLAALFVLFLPVGFAADVVDALRRRPSWVRAAQALAIVGSAVALVALWRGGVGTSRRVWEDGRTLAWFVTDALVLATVGWWLWRRRVPVDAGVLRLPRAARWLAVVPALAVLNGITPYLEVKTSYGWNMYSNLFTTDGESNHLLVPRTLPVSDAGGDLVRITASSDPGLWSYADLLYDVPFLQLRAYLADRPDVSLTYERGGEVHEVARAGDVPELVEPVSEVAERLRAYRAVDRGAITDPARNRCQPFFLPAH